MKLEEDGKLVKDEEGNICLRDVASDYSTEYIDDRGSSVSADDVFFDHETEFEEV